MRSTPQSAPQTEAECHGAFWTTTAGEVHVIGGLSGNTAVVAETAISTSAQPRTARDCAESRTHVHEERMALGADVGWKRGAQIGDQVTELEEMARLLSWRMRAKACGSTARPTTMTGKPTAGTTRPRHLG